MPEGELNYFVLITQHVEALVRNARLVMDLQSERERLATLNVQLEERVNERTSAFAQANSDLLQNVETLRNTQAMSRQTEIAEIASGVLHNLGNVLNSISVIARMLRQNSNNNASQGIDQIIESHKDNWRDLLLHDPRGCTYSQIHSLVRRSCPRRQQTTSSKNRRARRTCSTYPKGTRGPAIFR